MGKQDNTIQGFRLENESNAKKIWDNWSEEQRLDFLYKYNLNDIFTSAQKSIYEDYDDIHVIVKKALNDMVGQTNGKSPAEIWDSWTSDQKAKFMLDHDMIEERAEDLFLYDTTYTQLPSYAQQAIMEHVKSGMYKDGGIVDEIDFNNFGTNELDKYLSKIGGDIYWTISEGSKNHIFAKLPKAKFSDSIFSIGEQNKSINVRRGTENIYADLIVYDQDNDIFTISLYSKDNYSGLKETVNSIIKKFKDGGPMDEEDSWDNADWNRYDKIYNLFPDNYDEARGTWEAMSQSDKDKMVEFLDHTDAASEHISDSWLEFVNSKSYDDWLENATNWDEMKDGGQVEITEDNIETTATMQTAANFLQGLTVSALPTEMQTFIKDTLLTDPDQSLIPMDDPKIEMIRGLIEKKYPKALEAESTEPTREEVVAAIETLRFLADDDKDSADALFVLENMLEDMPEKKKDGGHMGAINTAKIIKIFNNDHFDDGGNVSKLTPEQEELINDLAEDFKPEVVRIEKKIKTTKNHYGDYVALLSAVAKNEKIARIFSMALKRAGANSEGVNSALQVMYGQYKDGGRVNKSDGQILQQNDTHKAVKNGSKIDIYSKGFIDGDYELKEEFLYSIPLENEDDLFAIFERYDEDNRINIAEAESEFEMGGKLGEGETFEEYYRRKVPKPKDAGPRPVKN